MERLIRHLHQRVQQELNYPAMPVLISAVTDMPGVRTTSLPSTRSTW
jgi:hypothetical protein